MTLLDDRVALGGGAGLLDPGSWFCERPRSWQYTRDGRDLLLAGTVTQPSGGPAVKRLLLAVDGRLAAIDTAPHEDDGRFTIFNLTGIRTQRDGPPASTLACKERHATASFAVNTATAYLTAVTHRLAQRGVVDHQVVRHRLAAAAVSVSSGRAMLEQLSNMDDPVRVATLCAAALATAFEAAELCGEAEAGRSIFAAELDQLRVLAAVEPLPTNPVLPEPPEDLPLDDHDVRSIVTDLGGQTGFVDELARIEALAVALPVGVCARVVTHRQVATGYFIGTDRYEDLITGKTLAAVAITEPGGGSDLDQLKTVVAPGPGGLVLNGTKTLVAGGIDADVLIVAAVLDHQPSSHPIVLVAVDTGRPEVHRTTLDTPVWSDAGFVTVKFHDYCLHPDDLLRAPDNAPAGVEELLNGLVRERLALAAQQIGFARRWLTDLPDHSLLRLRFVAAATLLRQSRLDMVDASMAKLACCAVAAEIANARLDSTTERVEDHINARAALSAAGTPDINREIVATSLFHDQPK